MRAQVYEVLVNGEQMAKKQFRDPNGADRAMQGHGILESNLPPRERPLLVPMTKEKGENAVVMPKLNNTAWVVSMGKNTSKDRDELTANKLKSIPNFNAVLKQLMDAVQECGDKCLAMGPDVYFLAIDKKTKELGYRYADTESMVTEGQVPPEETPLANIYWAAGMLYQFLQECVENPEPYLARVQSEALSRMNSYTFADKHWQTQLLEEGREWPANTWKQNVAWGLETLKRHLVNTWNS